MHQCHVCGRVLPDFEFYKCKKERICKECYKLREYKRIYKKELLDEQAQKFDFNKMNGGYVIRILNHTKPFEHKFNIQSTEGEVWATDDKEQFLKKLNELLIC